MLGELKTRLLTVPTEAQRKVVEAAAEPADSWTRYVQEFIGTYKLDRAQQETAWLMLKQVKARAQEYRLSHKMDYERIVKMSDKDAAARGIGDSGQTDR